jgi:hypothetical protein
MSEVSALERQLADAKDSIARRDIALKLYKNPDFKKLIIDEFCGTECARYAQASADPALGDRERADSLAIAQAAGHLRRFLSVCIAMGNQGERLTPEIEQAIHEARAEEGDE